MAEVDALGRGVGQARRAELGAAAAFDRRDLRPGDRGAGDRAVRRRRHRGGRHHARPPLPGAGADQGAAASTTTWPSSTQAKVVLDPARRARDHPGRRQELSPSRRASSWSRTRACWPRSPGLVEWPVVLMGSFDKAFLAIPDEVIRATIRNNQKCFVLRDPKTAKLANKFILVVEHRGQRRRQGDRRRQRARHPRAAVGREVLLRDRSEDAAGRPAAEVRAHRVPREARHAGRAHRAHRALAGEISRRIGRRRCREGRARGAALQGRSAHRSGRRISRAAGPDGQLLRRGAGRGRSRRPRHARITTSRRARTIWCRPIRCRSRSRSPTRSTRWSASGRSTRSRPGAKDPYALRRAALGVIRLVHRQQASCFASAGRRRCARSFELDKRDRRCEWIARHRADICIDADSARFLRRPPQGPAPRAGRAARSRRCRVRAAKARTILLLIVRRVEALGKFLDTDDGKNLLAGTKRAANILRIEEKKDNTRLHRRAGRRALLQQAEEKELAARHRRCQGGGRQRPSRRRTSPPP